MLASIRSAGPALLLEGETLPLSEIAAGAFTASGYAVSRNGQEYLRGSYPGRFRRNEVEIVAGPEAGIPVVALFAFALLSGGMNAS